MLKRTVKGIVTALALAFTGPAAAETLKEIVSFAIETHPQVQSAARKKGAADSAMQAARGGYYPRIDYVYGTGREHSKNTSTELIAPGQWVKLNRKQEGMTLNQMLFDGLGVSAEVDRRRAISDSNAHRVYGTAEEIGLQTIDAYLDVLKNIELVGFAKENLAAHQKTYDQVKLRADKGVGRRADLDQIDARLALAVSNLAASESTLRDAEITYLKVVGKMPVNLTKADSPTIPASVDEALKVGFQNHPVLRSALSDVEAAQAQREIAKSFNFPRLELEASYSENKHLDGVQGPNRDRLVMLWVKWNIFRGGFDFFRGEETAKQINEAQEISRNTHRQVEAAVRLAYNSFATARDRLPSLDRYVKSSDSTRVAYAQQFAIGQRTLLDLLDSENEYFTSRSTYTNAYYIELGSRYRVLNAMGALLSTLEVKPPEEAIARSATSMPMAPEKKSEAMQPEEKKAETVQPEQRAAVAPQPEAAAAETKPAEPPQAEAKQPEPTPVERKPAEQPQAESKQPEPMPVEAKPVEQPRAEAAQPAPAPVRAIAAEQTQADTTQLEPLPIEPKPADLPGQPRAGAGETGPQVDLALAEEKRAEAKR